MVVELERAADLLDPSRIEDDDAVGHGHRLDLVVGDVDRGGAEGILELGDLEPHLDAERGVEIRQRLVEEEGLRFADDGAADRHPLALAAGELAGPPVEVGGEVEDLRRGVDLLVDLALRPPGHAEPEADVLAHAHMRVERVGLEHHRQAALRRRRIDHVDPVDQDLAGGRVLEPGDEPEQRGLAAARRPDEDDEGAVVDGEVDVADDADLAEALLDAFQFDLAHDGGPYFTAPKVRPRTSWRWLNQPSTRIGAMASVDAAESFAQNSPSGLE